MQSVFRNKSDNRFKMHRPWIRPSFSNFPLIRLVLVEFHYHRCRMMGISVCTFFPSGRSTCLDFAGIVVGYSKLMGENVVTGSANDNGTFNTFSSKCISFWSIFTNVLPKLMFASALFFVVKLSPIFKSTSDP